MERRGCRRGEGMAIQIDEILKAEVPHILRSHGFNLQDHPDCRRLINTIIDHLKNLLIDAQNEIETRLTIERLSKLGARRKSFENWIYTVCFNFVGFYKDGLSLQIGKGREVPCDLSVLQIDLFPIAAQSTFDHVNRRDRRRPHGGRRRTTHFSLPLKLHTEPSRR